MLLSVALSVVLSALTALATVFVLRRRLQASSLTDEDVSARLDAAFAALAARNRAHTEKVEDVLSSLSDTFRGAEGEWAESLKAVQAAVSDRLNRINSRVSELQEAREASTVLTRLQALDTEVNAIAQRTDALAREFGDFEARPNAADFDTGQQEILDRISTVEKQLAENSAVAEQLRAVTAQLDGLEQRIETVTRAKATDAKALAKSETTGQPEFASVDAEEETAEQAMPAAPHQKPDAERVLNPEPQMHKPQSPAPADPASAAAPDDPAPKDAPAPAPQTTKPDGRTGDKGPAGAIALPHGMVSIMTGS